MKKTKKNLVPQEPLAINKVSAVPLYTQIKALILQSIDAGELKVNEKIPSEKELADKYGVSRITTKQALDDLVKEGFVYRVAGKGSFVKTVNPVDRAAENPVAPPQTAGFVPKKSMVSVGLILPYLNDSYEMGIISGVEKELRKKNYHLIFRKSDNSVAEENRAIEALREEGVKGLIIFPTEGMYCCDALMRLKIEQFPFVLVDRFYRGVDTNYVVSDNYAGAYQAGEYLVNLGHRAIGLIGYTPENVVSINDRIRGFKQALADHGVPLPSAQMELSLEREQTYNHITNQADGIAIETIQNFLQKNPDLTGIFATTDYTAICALRAGLQMGRSVPGDLSIIGFDNNILSANVEVPLTTIDQPEGEIGKNAALLLHRILTNENRQTEKVVLPTKLIIRNSTASPGR